MKKGAYGVWVLMLHKCVTSYGKITLRYGNKSYDFFIDQTFMLMFFIWILNCFKIVE